MKFYREATPQDFKHMEDWYYENLPNHVIASLQELPKVNDQLIEEVRIHRKCGKDSAKRVIVGYIKFLKAHEDHKLLKTVYTDY